MQPMPLLSYMILDCILEDCVDRTSGSTLPPENFVHALTSLKKTFNRLTVDLVSNSERSVKPTIENILLKAFACLYYVCSKLLVDFSTQISVHDIISVTFLPILQPLHYPHFSLHWLR